MSRRGQSGLSVFNPGNYLISHKVALAVPSALRGLTSVFGMGTGVTLSVRSPETCCNAGQSPRLRVLDNSILMGKRGRAQTGKLVMNLKSMRFMIKPHDRLVLV